MKILITGCSQEDNLGTMIARQMKEIRPNAEIIAINNVFNFADKNVLEKVITREYNVNLSKIGSTINLCEEVSIKEGKIDIFIHAAGLSNLSWIKDINYDKFQDTINVNAIAPVVIVKELMENLAGGTCLFISSNASHIPMRCSLAYNMSKAALTMATKQMARELTLSMNMTIFSISPNKLENTGMSKITDNIVPELRGWTNKEADEIQNSAMLNGEQTDPVEFAKFVSHLLSDKNRHKMMSGCDIPYGA